MTSSYLFTHLLDLSVCLAFLLSTVDAQDDSIKTHRFVTRPELKAPKWNITIYDQEKVSSGYWFVAPYEKIDQTEPGDGSIGPHIYDGHGELVWSGAHMFNNMSVMDFRISNYKDQDVMTLIRPEERAGILLDNHFNIVEQVAIEGFNMHEWNFVDDGVRSLVITRKVMNADVEDSRATGLDDGLCEANFNPIEELNTRTWEPVWNWTSRGRIALEETTFKYGSARERCEQGGEWDFLHANAVDKCPDGDIILSARHTDTIYKISRQDGSIVWRLGGVKNDFRKTFHFSRQHDVRCRSQNETHTMISFLDNAKGEDPQTPSNPFSRGLLVALETETRQASIVTQFNHPHGEGGYAHRRGSFQVLETNNETNNVLMCWSEQSLLSEHTPDGKMVMQASLMTEWLGTYRGYKFPFVGMPSTSPDVYAQAFDPSSNEGATVTEVYASWNGATEVSAWKLYKTDEKGETKVQLEWIPKAGFETAISYGGFAKFVFVEAIDVEGNMLGRSSVFVTIPPPNVLTPAVAEEELWQQQMGHGEAAAAYNSQSSADADGYLGVFAGGFVLSALCLIMLAMRCVRHRAIAIMKKLPWHHGQEPRGYQPLEGRNDSSVSIEKC